MGGHQHRPAPLGLGEEVWDDRLLPVRDDPADDVGQALGGRQVGRRHVAVAGVGRRPAPGHPAGRGGGRDVVAAPPQLDLGLAVLGRRLLLVEPLQRAVVALVQPPVAADRQPAPPGLAEGQLGGGDGPDQHRGVQDPQVEVVLGGHQRPGRPGLGLAVGAQLDVDPPGEQVLGVPDRLPVPEQDQVGHGRSVPGPRRGPDDVDALGAARSRNPGR